MSKRNRNLSSKWWNSHNIWKLPVLIGFLVFMRLNNGFIINDVLFFLSKPFLHVESKREVVKNMIGMGNIIKIQQLKKDNDRLRKLLDLQYDNEKDYVNAAVISRKSSGWWQQLLINKGSKHGIYEGYAVLGTGGLLGIVESVTPFTSKVRLLTSPSSKIGVWSQRTESHGILIGNGSHNPNVIFFQKDPDIKIGDKVTSSPASTILPPNMPIGIVISFKNDSLPSPKASIQLISKPEAIDWVEIIPLKNDDKF